MSYCGFQKQDALILGALRRHHQVGGQSFKTIMLSVNNFRASRGLPRYKHDELEANAKTISRFHNNENIKGDGLKRDLWDFYIAQNLILDEGSRDDVSLFMLSSDNFFRQNEKIQADITNLSGRYSGYKRAIRDPESLCIKFMSVFMDSELAPNLLRIRETHVNRTFKPSHAEVISELWSGTLLRRAQANYFGIVREDLLGTPHAYTLHSTQTDTDGKKAVQLFGESIEIVENWGKTSTLQSRVIFEREPDNLTEDEVIDSCDLIFVDKLRETRPDIVNYIWGSK